MSTDILDRKVSEAYKRLSALKESGRQLPKEAQRLIADALEELGVALEELHVAGEELHQQNEQLQAVQGELTRERWAYEQLFELAPDPYLTTDGEGCIREANVAALLLLEASLPDLLGRPLSYFIAHTQKEDFAGRLVGLGETRTPQRWQTAVIPLPDGCDPIPVVMSAAVVRDREDQIAGFRWLVRDITESRRWEDALAKHRAKLQEANARLAEINAEMESFTYSVSHDLRAPLRAMSGFARALLEDYAGVLDDDGREYLGRISGAARHMDALIQDLLAYSRLVASDVEIGPVDLQAAVAEALDHLDEEICASGADVEVSGPLPWVIGNRPMLVQAVSNLLGNAVKFVLEGRKPVVRVDAETEDRRARLWIRDNGIGVALQHQTQIFQTFQRLHGIEAYPGTGIGLAIVKRSAERMGGQAGVQSRLGEGSAFWIDLPLADTGAGAATGA